MKHCCRNLAAAILVLATSAPAFAQFTRETSKASEQVLSAMGDRIVFQVPLKIDKVPAPADHQPKVWCMVAGTTGVIGQNAPALSENGIPFSLSAGAFSGTIAVPVEASEGKSLVDATDYMCRFFFRAPNNGILDPKSGSAAPWNRPRPGSPFNPKTEGKLNLFGR